MDMTKAEMMRRLRKRREDAGLVPVTCWVEEIDKARLADYVVHTLGGECKVRTRK